MYNYYLTSLNPVQYRFPTISALNQLGVVWMMALTLFGLETANQRSGGAKMAALQMELRGVTEWFSLGVQLEIPRHVLLAIRHHYRSTDDCRLNMLIKWAELETPTWTKLIRALNNIGEKRLAEEIAEKCGLRHPRINMMTKPKVAKRKLCEAHWVKLMDETEQGLRPWHPRLKMMPKPKPKRKLSEAHRVKLMDETVQGWIHGTPRFVTQPKFRKSLGLETDGEQKQGIAEPRYKQYHTPQASWCEHHTPQASRYEYHTPQASGYMYPTPRQDPNSQLVRVEDIEYVDRDPFGYGHYGNVRKVRYKGKICAAKYFHERQGMREKVKKEANILSKLQRYQHSNIVRYIGANTTIAQPVLIMELLQTNLHNYIKENPAKFTLISAILQLLHDVSKGLEYLHEQNVIHRDLTVNNVLLDKHGVAKVADFGNSRVIEFDSPIDVATMTIQPGARLYCAPETISTVGCPRGPRYNNKVDIFSFGQLSAVVVTQKFPEDIDPCNIKSVADLRQIYMCDVEKKLWGHPFLGLIRSCLNMYHDARPSASVLQTKLGELHDEEESQTETESDSEQSDSEESDSEESLDIL